MISDGEKCSPPVLQKDSARGSSVSSDLQEEHEELLRYVIVTPNTESGASQPSHSKWEAVPDIKIPSIIDEMVWLPFFWLQTLLCFTVWTMTVVLLLTTLALVKCFKNAPFLASRGDLPKCQSELIWMIFIAVPQGLELLACCFWMSYFDGR